MAEELDDSHKIKLWGCKIGETKSKNIPPGGDGPMRKAVKKAYIELTGEEPHFIFSGWGEELTEGEREFIENTTS